MADLPKHNVRKIERHEWVISNNGDPLSARQLSDGIYFATKEMDKLGVDLSYDDAYHILAEENEITLYVERDEGDDF